MKRSERMLEVKMEQLKCVEGDVKRGIDEEKNEI